MSFISIPNNNEYRKTKIKRHTEYFPLEAHDYD